MKNLVVLEGTLKNVTPRGEGDRKFYTGTVSQRAGRGYNGAPYTNAFANFVAFDKKAQEMLNGLVDLQEQGVQVVIQGELSYYTPKATESDKKPQPRIQVILSSIVRADLAE